MFKNAYAYLIILLLSFSASVHGQGIQVEYGKNRVQYHRDFDEWSKYESDNFITYWYGEARNVGQAVVQIAEYDFYRIQGILEHRLNDKLQIIVYTDITDIKQSNIGSEEAFNNTSGQTKIVGNKIFVYFDGNHNHLRRQIREGIASVYLDAMLFGSNLQEIVQNAVMLNLPDWFKQGLVSYASENWNTELDNELRDLFTSQEIENFEKFAEEHPRLAGHSLWYFIGENFGKPTVSNLLYLTRINRSIESGFLYVLGTSYELVIDSWKRYFRARYQIEVRDRHEPNLNPLVFKNKRNLPVTQLKISPNGQNLVYVTNEIGKYKVYLHNLITDERKVIFKFGFRNPFQATDYNYPLLAWNPSGLEIAILYERRDIPKLLTYDVTTGKTKSEDLSTELQRVFSIDYVNPVMMVFSAASQGYSDLFLYFTNTRQFQRITQDFWDDLDASVVRAGDKQGILFISNRQDSILKPERLDTILPINNFDVFYYDLTERSPELVRVTNTPFANERQPVAIDSVYFSYLSDESGIYNREAAYLEEYIHHYDQIITLKDGSEIVLHADSSLAELDSTTIDTIIIEPVIKQRAIAHTVTNYNRNIETQHTAPRAGRVAELIISGNKPRIFTGELLIDTVMTPPATRYRYTRGRALGLSDVAPPAAPPSRQPVVPQKQAAPPAPPAEPEAPEAPPIISVLPMPPQDTIPEKTEAPEQEEYLFQSRFDDEREDREAQLQPEEVTEAPIEEPAELVPAAPEEQIPLLRAAPAEYREIEDEPETYRFRPGRIVPYRVEFRTDYVTTRLDNNLLFGGLEAYGADQGRFEYPPPGILFKANFKDLFEDYEIEGGLRVPTTFNGTEYFLIYKNKKKRLDKSFAIYRKNLRLTEDSRSIIPNVPNKREVNTLLGQFGLRYPLDIFRSLRATFTLRRDRNTQLASDRSTLETPTEQEQRIGLQLEYVFDNTLDVSYNIKNGSRYKVYAGIVKKFDLQVFDGFSLDFNKGFMTILGVDARNYQRVLKYSVFATRFAAATSFGSEKMLYFLGGVDNWLFPKYNENIPVPEERDDLSFKALAAHMRGFDINIRNGSSYALINAELRVPMFRYLFPRTKSSLLRNFQVVGFFDVGTAWEGSDPFSDENPLNTTIIRRSDQVEVKVNFFRDPVVAGYGVGARALIFGYFLKVDYAWGIETRRVQDPILYFSLGTDF